MKVPPSSTPADTSLLGLTSAAYFLGQMSDPDFCDLLSSPLQAKYLAQIIVMGAQVVGRAFARALQQEYAGMIHHRAVIVHNVVCRVVLLRHDVHPSYLQTL